MPYTYRYPRPAVAVDIAVVRPSARGHEVLLIRRGRPPFKNSYALPGGFVEIDEDLPDAARRELLEETGLKARRLELVGVFGRPGRDPRGRVISAVYLVPIRGRGGGAARAGDDAKEVSWHSLARPPKLAFDHAEILVAVRRLLKEKPGLLSGR